MKWLNKTDLVIKEEKTKNELCFRQIGWLGQTHIFYSMDDDPSQFERGGFGPVFMQIEGRRFDELKEEDSIRYERELLKTTIIFHQQIKIQECLCGWSILGASWADHVINVYEEAIELIYNE